MSSGIIEGGKLLGIEIKFVPSNDLICAGKKISGNAQTRRNGVILQHGTILLNVDVDKMFRFYCSSQKLKGKMIESVKERVTSISQILGRELTFDEAVDVFTKGYQQAFKSLNFVLSEVNPEEEAKARIYAQEKYSSEEWKFKF